MIQTLNSQLATFTRIFAFDERRVLFKALVAIFFIVGFPCLQEAFALEPVKVTRELPNGSLVSGEIALQNINDVGAVALQIGDSTVEYGAKHQGRCGETVAPPNVKHNANGNNSSDNGSLGAGNSHDDDWWWLAGQCVMLDDKTLPVISTCAIQLSNMR